MDESCAAETREDTATSPQPDCNLGRSDPESTLNEPSEDPAPMKEGSLTCQDCGLTFSHLSTYNTHLHQHSLEEEEAPTGECGSPRVCVKEEDLDVVESSLAETFLNPLGGNAEGNQGFVCKICGKTYKYVVSYRKHLSIHQDNNKKEKSQSQPLRKYECPDCGMSFIRRTRLISHLRVHRAREAVTIPECDQCNKKFTSAKSWLSHLQIHKEKQFWCLSCSQGYLDELSLDKHLQRHSLNSFKKKTDNRQQSNRQMTCEVCGKCFPGSKEFLSHQKIHTDNGIQTLTQEEEEDGENNAELHGDEDSEMNADVEELQRAEENTDVKMSPNRDVNAEMEKSDESDCGEPVHCFELAKLLSWADLPAEKAPDDPSERQKPREHKYCEWECILCDSGFDEVGKLHMHYTKHATGEIPIPHE